MCLCAVYPSILSFRNDFVELRDASNEPLERVEQRQHRRLPSAAGRRLRQHRRFVTYSTLVLPPLVFPKLTTLIRREWLLLFGDLTSFTLGTAGNNAGFFMNTPAPDESNAFQQLFSNLPFNGFTLQQVRFVEKTRQKKDFSYSHRQRCRSWLRTKSKLDRFKKFFEMIRMSIQLS